MMFSRPKGANPLSVLKSKFHGESSLTTGLLKDVSPEIELSDYGRIPPSPDSESPSGLLNGDTLNVEPIADLDLFFERLYSYYCDKGLWCIIIKWIVELLSLGFTICFSGFFLLYVDWNGLRNAKCGMDAVESGIKPCDLAKEALHQHPLTPLTLTKAIIVGYLGIFSIYWIFCFLRFFAQLKDTLGIRHFYYTSLHVTDKEIQTLPWATIVEKVVQLQSSQQLCVVKDLSAHDVMMRLMRKENYLIGMLNKGVLAFPISQWVPGAGPTVKLGSNGIQHRLILTKTLEWTLNWCILQSMFDRNFCVKRDFISNPATLKKRLMVVGLAMLLLSPFLVIFMLVYLFLRHAEQFYNHPSTASSQRWSTLAKWIFREYNEVDHLFKHRINTSVEHASNYLKQFPSPIISIIAKFISFVSGGFAAILIIIAFLEESLLEGHIFGRNLFWYAAVFGTITAISRAAVTDELLVLDPEGAMSLVVQHTHYMPKRWRAKENTQMVWIEFETLFQFIANFTVNVEGVGHVCSFCSSYPSWEPNAQGKQVLLNLRTFREQNLQGQGTRQAYSPSRMWRGSPLFTGLRDRRGILSREVTHNSPRTGYQLDSLWLIDSDQKNHPYLLDWYYTSRPNLVTGCSRDIPQEPCQGTEEHPLDYWMRASPTQNEPRYEDCWGDNYEGRTQSHLGASASTPFFRDSVIQHHASGSLANPTRSQWWARTDPHGVQAQTSFLEPPAFNHPTSGNHYEIFSDRSSEEQDQHLDWRINHKLFRTTNTDDLEAGEFNLHFDDVYSGHPEIHRINQEPTSLETPRINQEPTRFD
ncbi:Autophagy-related protein 9 [Morella rubra]|uniref:Autophagy-related protein 9 n=1 Tax=Morella rubra TaxID=262757 RepID=A0A6A1VM86_9ROSI|nr:Autophagy-related protein 9 [Morella rubra]